MTADARTRKALSRFRNTTQLTQDTWVVRAVASNEPRDCDDLVLLDDVEAALAAVPPAETEGRCDVPRHDDGAVRAGGARADVAQPLASLEELRRCFLALSTKRQKQCPHGQATKPERCVSCVIDEGVSVLAVNQTITMGINDTTIDAYLESAVPPAEPAPRCSKCDQPVPDAGDMICVDCAAEPAPTAHYMQIVPGSERYFCRVEGCTEYAVDNVPHGYCAAHRERAITGETLSEKLGFPPIGKPVEQRVSSMAPAPAEGPQPVSLPHTIAATMAYLKQECEAQHERAELAESRLREVEAERNKWLAAFNKSEQFQNGPTKRAEKAEAESAALQQRVERLTEDAATVADFIITWHPGYEDAISWGSDGPNGVGNDNAVYQAAQRLRAALAAETGEPK